MFYSFNIDHTITFSFQCLQDQLQSLEVLRDSSRRSFTAVSASYFEIMCL